MTHLIAISGSLRRASFNTGLLHAASELMPGGVSLEIADISAIPLYDGDVEASDGIPAPVEQLKERLIASSGLLLATPEYNNSLPGVLKNAIDWLTRPPADIPRVFHGRPVAVIGASPGGFGTTLAQDAWLPVIRTLRMRPWFEGRLMVARAGTLFDADGRLTDADTRAKLETFVAGFARFAQANIL